MAIPPQLVLRMAQAERRAASPPRGIERMVSMPNRRSTDGINFERSSPTSAHRPVARPMAQVPQHMPQHMHGVPMDGRPCLLHASHVAPPGQWSSPRMAPLSSTARTQLNAAPCLASPRPLQEAAALDMLSRSSRELQVPPGVVGHVGLYQNARASIVTGPPALWGGSPPLSPRFAVSPRGYQAAYQAERPGGPANAANGLWEQHRLQAMQQLRRTQGTQGEAKHQGHQGHQGYILEAEPSQRYIIPVGHQPTSHLVPAEPSLDASTKRSEAAAAATAAVLAPEVRQMERPEAREAPKQGSGPSPPREKSYSTPGLAESPRPEAVEEPLQATSQLVADRAPASEVPTLDLGQQPVEAEAGGQSGQEEPERKSASFDSPRDACNKNPGKATELMDRIAQLEAQVSDRATLLARLNCQQAQLDRLEALAEENASLRTQLRRRGAAKGDTPPMSARGELSRERGSVETPTMARRFRTAPGEVQTHADAPVVLTARSPRPEGKVAMVEKTLAELEKALGLQGQPGSKQIILET